MFEVPTAQLAAALLLAAAAGCGGSGTPAPQHPMVASDDAPAHRAVAPDIGDRDDGDSGMQVSGLHGRLDQYDIQQGVKPHADAINRCYHDNIVGHAYVSGTIKLAFRIARDGTVKKVRIAKSDLGAWPVEKCLLEIARAMTFAHPSGGEAKFSLPLEFSDDGAVTTWDDARVDTELHNEPALEAWRKRQRYRRRHHRHHHRRHHHAVVDPKPKTKLQKLASCSGDAGGPAPSGALVTAYVGRDGTVTMAGFAADDRAHIDPAWADCALAQIKTWKLTAPRGGVAKLSFHYPVTR